MDLKASECHVLRCFGTMRIDVIAAVGSTGGGIARTHGVVGIQYLQAGEFERLRSDGVNETTLTEMNTHYAQEVIVLKHPHNEGNQLTLF